MKACIFDGILRVDEVEKPDRQTGEILIRVTTAGICNTDHEILRGYVPGFNGIPGHEFIGIVEDADTASLVGRRCTAEINCACGSCEFCRQGLGRHCPHRSVVGIMNRNGAFAEYIVVPQENCVLIPDTIPDTRALFIEPLAAALEILDQVTINQDTSVLCIGDGKLGLLIAHVLAATGCATTVVGKHPEKLALLHYSSITSVLVDEFTDGKYDVVIEATGNGSVFDRALRNVKPRGILVLKSTYAEGFTFNPSPVVVHEITIIGSRCGRFNAALDFLASHECALERMISREFDLDRITEAFEYSSRSEVLKVILRI